MAVFTGTSGNDFLSGGPNADTLNGLGGDDNLFGSGGADILNGGSGHDFFSGGTGNDRLIGGSGNDCFEIYSDSGNDTFDERVNGGNDFIFAHLTFSLASRADRANIENVTLVDTGNFNATGNALGNFLIGNSGRNILSGLDGNDTMRGGFGRDTTIGGKGNDTHIVEQSDDKVVEVASGGGTDTLESSFFSLDLDSSLFNNVENARLGGSSNFDLTGDGGINNLFGNFGNNVLDGGGGNDILRGGGGADRLIGGPGADSLRGDDGNDTLVWHASDTKVDGGNGDDTLEVGGNTDLNLTAIPNTLIVKVEGIDLLGGNTLTLVRNDVLDMSPTGTLFVTGTEAADIVSSQFWTFIEHVGESTVAIYGNGSAELHVQTDINRAGLATFNLNSLNGGNGIIINGAANSDRAGTSVALADIDGDGDLDIVVGSPLNNASGMSNAGAVHVIKGGTREDLDDAQGGGGISLADIAPLGIQIRGASIGDQAGTSVSAAGDVNNDGFGDVLIGIRNVGPDGSETGGAALVLGGATPADVSLGNLTGANGALFLGPSAGSLTNTTVSAAGDFNGDGFGDVLIGSAAGAFVVEGGDNETLTELAGPDGFNLGGVNGSNGIKISAPPAGSDGSRFVFGGADFNGDGLGDFGITTSLNGNQGFALVFGGPGLASNFNTSALDGVNGFFLATPMDASLPGGVSVAAGDVDGDGNVDLIFAQGNGVGVVRGGNSEHWDLAHGTSGLDVSALDGLNGFFAFDSTFTGGLSVAAGDVNGDGRDDIVIGDPGRADDSGGFSTIYGTEVLSALHGKDNVNSGLLDGFFGFQAVGGAGSRAGISVAVGDVDGDGFADILSGAPSSGPTPGSASLLFGGNFNSVVDHAGDTGDNVLTGNAEGQVFVAGNGNDTATGGGGAASFRMGSGADLVIADDAFRLIDGGAGFDTWAPTGTVVDLTTKPGKPVVNVEQILLSENMELSLSLMNLFGMSEGTDSLTIDGDASNVVDVNGEWTLIVRDDNYNEYTATDPALSGWKLTIYEDIQQNLTVIPD